MATHRVTTPAFWNVCVQFVLLLVLMLDLHQLPVRLVQVLTQDER